MYINFWLERMQEILENERQLVKPGSSTLSWFEKMPSTITAICPIVKKMTEPDHFGPKVGIIHHLKYSTSLGIEGVFKAPRKYHSYKIHIIFDAYNQPGNPFWAVVFK